jgi:hypothetical protein
MNRFAAFLLALLPFVQGCSSSYEPARSPRIATVVAGSEPVFVKDGQRYGSAVYGFGLGDAVRGNPVAEAEARTGRNLAIGGLVLDIAGLATEGAGLAVAIDSSRVGGPDHQAAANALIVGGLASVLVGTVLLLSAPPHIYDAVNIYNDGLEHSHAPEAP